MPMKVSVEFISRRSIWTYVRPWLGLNFGVGLEWGLLSGLECEELSALPVAAGADGGAPF